ncbi:pectin acetylesterase 8-like isoform X1 [Solanum pennellii]|uniref:Pectin acetylesterase n=2 Tax=Solanum pennellii TaxID=28526 RepID=A0ABM1FRK2_SOLPN|nr:pectin acetylesterase 8-like isoform X1 [Solanum pennellii]
MLTMSTRSVRLVCLLICSLAISKTDSTKANELLKQEKHADHAYFVDITIVQNAVSKGAVCLDGSPPAYHLDPGFGHGVRNWIILLSGGAWCRNTTDCLNRSKTDLGSSTLMLPFIFLGIFSKSKTENPDFYNWNKVFVRYCDGGAFTGDIENVDSATNLHFRGARIFDAIIEDLLAKGLKDAKNAILSGGSANGYPAMLYCDHFHSLLPKAHRVKCLVDAGYFIRVKNPLLTNVFESIFKDVVTLHGSTKVLPKSCTSRMKPELCFFPENIQRDIKTPFFTVMSAFDSYQVNSIIGSDIGECIQARNCTENQNNAFKELRSEFLRALPKANDPKQRGVFIDSFNHHTQLELWWNKINATPVNNLTTIKVFGDCYYDRKYSYVIDEHDLPLPVYLYNNGTLKSRG